MKHSIVKHSDDFIVRVRTLSMLLEPYAYQAFGKYSIIPYWRWIDNNNIECIYEITWKDDPNFQANTGYISLPPQKIITEVLDKIRECITQDNL